MIRKEKRTLEIIDSEHRGRSPNPKHPKPEAPSARKAVALNSTRKGSYNGFVEGPQ